ncbi:response regulator [Microbacterium hydrocarbonoxydans]|uniref:response regulator n=1 Tax=Microbacterium hydrocarbonoxydans TaxID=273678 RepID=UPI00203C4213|nr:response regulator [Microbacterium hydrocarbonoxydans]MCM3778560.1 response regulator [Microbacterium hydrocarbonoxydans]
MHVSVEVIAIIACGVSVIVAFVSACGWFLTRMDARFAAADARMDARFAAADARMDARFAAADTRIDRLETRMGGVEHELSEVKVAIARLEGPLPRLVTSR